MIRVQLRQSIRPNFVLVCVGTALSGEHAPPYIVRGRGIEDENPPLTMLGEVDIEASNPSLINKAA